MHMGGNVVVVVYVVVTTVVLVAGANENCPIVANGSRDSGCIIFDVASEPRLWPGGAEAMLHERACVRGDCLGRLERGDESESGCREAAWGVTWSAGAAVGEVVIASEPRAWSVAASSGTRERTLEPNRAYRETRDHTAHGSLV